MEINPFTFQEFFLLWEEKASSAARHQSNKLQQPESDTEIHNKTTGHLLFPHNVSKMPQQ